MLLSLTGRPLFFLRFCCCLETQKGFRWWGVEEEKKRKKNQSGWEDGRRGREGKGGTRRRVCTGLDPGGGGPRRHRCAECLPSSGQRGIVRFAGQARTWKVPTRGVMLGCWGGGRFVSCLFFFSFPLLSRVSHAAGCRFLCGVLLACTTLVSVYASGVLWRW